MYSIYSIFRHFTGLIASRLFIEHAALPFSYQLLSSQRTWIVWNFNQHRERNRTNSDFNKNDRYASSTAQTTVNDLADPLGARCWTYLVLQLSVN